jgi:hypothetical protein
MKEHALVAILIVFFYSCNSSDKNIPASNTDSISGVAANTKSAPPSIEKGFDINSIPVSGKDLAPFPYFNLPEGYQSRANEKAKDVDRFPFWVGDHFEWIVGKTYSNYIKAKEGKEFSGYEVTKSLDTELTGMGAVRIFNGIIPADSSYWLDQHFNGLAVNYVDGLGDIYNDPTATYVIHRKDKNIWIHLCVGTMSGGWVIANQSPADKAKR